MNSAIFTDPSQDISIVGYPDHAISEIKNPEELGAVVRKWMDVAVRTNVHSMTDPSGDIAASVGYPPSWIPPARDTQPGKLTKFTYGGFGTDESGTMQRLLHTKHIDDSFMQVTLPFPGYAKERHKADLGVEATHKMPRTFDILDFDEQYTHVFYTVPGPIVDTVSNNTAATDKPRLMWHKGWIAAKRDPMPSPWVTPHRFGLLRHALAASVTFAMHTKAVTGSEASCFLPTVLNRKQRAWVNFSNGYFTVVAQMPTKEWGTITPDSTECLQPVLIR